MGDSNEHRTILWFLGLLALGVPFGLRLSPPDHLASVTVSASASKPAPLPALLAEVGLSADAELSALTQYADVVVATIPDPDAGALGVLADQAIDAISSSAVRAGYL